MGTLRRRVEFKGAVMVEVSLLGVEVYVRVLDEEESCIDPGQTRCLGYTRLSRYSVKLSIYLQHFKMIELISINQCIV